MSVVGIDFGNLNTVVAVARNRGIDVITNETSNRATPSLVSLTDKQRFLGEGAKTLEISNFKSTVSGLKRLAGRPFSDSDIAAHEKKFINARLVEGERKEVAASVSYLDEQTEFTFTQLSAMFLAKVKAFTATELGIPVSDCVISCPTWFTDAQRRAVLDASNVAGLNCLRLMNDTTASALGYGITKTDLPEADAADAKPRIVTFFDMGHSSCQVAVVSFVKGKLTVLGTACDRNLGGRDFDEVIVQHYIKEFNKKYKLDIESSAKAIFRLRTGAEKVKKILSANSQAPFNVESLLDDKDVSAMVSRADFEEMSATFVQRVLVPLEAALATAGVTPDQVDFVELVGGSTRIPMVKEAVAKFFGGSLDGDNKIATTLNLDEAVARGCAFQCAMLSPVFKVRDFSVSDINTHAIELSWDASTMPDPKKGEKLVTHMDAFTVNNALPSAKVLSLTRALRNKELGKVGEVSLAIKAAYSKTDSSLPSGTDHHIGEWTIHGIKKLASTIVKEGDRELSAKATIKVKAKLDGNGLVSLESAAQVEELVVPADEKEGQEGVETVEVKGKTKKILKRHELTVTAKTAGGATTELLEKWLTAEGEMSSNDRLVTDTAEQRNNLEAYVYETRSKVSDQWSEFVVTAEGDKFRAKLNDMEDWLYGEGEDAQKSVYVEKLIELRKIGDPIATRYTESELRPSAEKALRTYINNVLLDIQAKGDKYAHIDAAEIKSVADEANKKLAWLNDAISKQNQLPKHAPLAVTVDKIRKEQKALLVFVTGILNKPKPKPAAKEEPKAAEPEVKEDSSSMEEDSAPALEEVEDAESMNVD